MSYTMDFESATNVAEDDMVRPSVRGAGRRGGMGPVHGEDHVIERLLSLPITT